LDRLPIRKALAYGIDKDRLVEALADGESIRQPTYNYIPPRLPGFFPIYDAQNYDLEKAARILEEQGFAPEKKFPELILFLPSPRTDFNLKFSRELENQLEKLEIPLNIKYYRSLTELREFKKPYLAALRVMMDFPDAENIVRPLYYSATDNSGTWYGYDNPGLDKLFQEAEVERSRARRVELFRKMEKILGEDLPSIPLYSEERRIAVQPYVRGLRVPALGFDYVDAKDIWLVKKE
jgi:ABC-type transport system substrate-binding protein